MTKMACTYETKITRRLLALRLFGLELEEAYEKNVPCICWRFDTREYSLANEASKCRYPSGVCGVEKLC
jgi:hypothetical protein